MKKQVAKKRINKLKKEIEHHRYLYHVLDTQEISDGALDSLKDELSRLERQYPEFISFDSPSQKVGGKPLAKFIKASHSERMISLFDAFSLIDMQDWEERNRRYLAKKDFDLEGFDYYAELKLDGLAIAIRYESSVLSMAITRGDGALGEVVTHNIRTIASLPLRLRQPKEIELRKIGLNKSQSKKIFSALSDEVIEIRGEVIMTKKDFVQLNKKYRRSGKAELANTRNGAAGSLRQLDPTLAAERKLDFYAYDLLGDYSLEKQEQKFAILSLLGIKTLKYNAYCKNLTSVNDYYKKWEKKKDDLPFACDGLVIKVNDLNLWGELGIVGKGPRYMVAYKFPAEQATSRVINIFWQVGRTGTLTPVAELEPVSVAGATISKSTLHNMDEIIRLGLKIGDTVIIERAGDVIPKIVKVLPKLRDGREEPVALPKKCPACGGQVEKIGNEVALRCQNKNCYAMGLRNLVHFVSKNALDIEGLGEKAVEQLFRAGLVRDIADFYELKKGDILALERFAEKSADNLLAAIKEKKIIILDKFIFALGIHHVGEETAGFLAHKFQIDNDKMGRKIKIQVLIKYFCSFSMNELEKMPDIGPIVAKSIFSWWQSENNQNILRKLAKNNIFLVNKKHGQKQVFQGKNIVLTGSLQKLTRSRAKDRIRELGGKASSALTKTTDLLVVGKNPGSKYERAEKLGVKIIGEEDFAKMLQEGMV